MKTNQVLTLSAIALGLLFASSAQAGWSVGISIGAPVYHPGPRPVCPPPVVYCPPRPVCPPVVYLPPGHARHGHHYDRHRGYGHYQPGYGHRVDKRHDPRPGHR